jgi:hypothetical protein
MRKLNGPISTKVLALTLLALFSSAMLGCGRTQAAAPPPRVSRGRAFRLLLVNCSNQGTSLGIPAAPGSHGQPDLNLWRNGIVATAEPIF